MNVVTQSKQDGPFKRRRTFAIGSATLHLSEQTTPRYSVPENHRDTELNQAPQQQQQERKQRNRLQRTVSAPAFTRRAVEPLLAPTSKVVPFPTICEAAVRHAALRPLLPQSRSQETHTSSDKSVSCHPVSSVTTPRRVLHYVNGSHSVSPDPRKPSVVPYPDVSPIRTLFDSTEGVLKGYNIDTDNSDAASSSGRPQTAELVPPSVASSIQSGALGVINDVSFGSKWYPSWSSSRCQSQLDTTPGTYVGKTGGAAPAAAVSPVDHSLNHQHSMLSHFETPEGKKQSHPEANLATFTHTSILDETPANHGGHGSAEGVSSILADALGQTMLPHKSTTFGNTMSSVETSKNFVRQVRIRVESCTGLPSAPLGEADKDYNNGAEARESKGVRKSSRTQIAGAAPPALRSGTEVYVYMRSNQGTKRYKSASVPYAATVHFPFNQADFVVPFTAVSTGCKGGDGCDEATLTFTVAAKRATGKQVKIGICEFALCNLREGHRTRISMPVVGKAGTCRARERCVLVLLVRAEGCGLPHELLPPLGEAFVRERIVSVMRRTCPEKLHRAEVQVRRRCCDSLAELQRFLAMLEADYLPAETKPANVTYAKSHNFADEERTQPRKVRTRASTPSSSPSSAPSLSRANRKGSNSSPPFTFCVRGERSGLHRNISYTAPQLELKVHAHLSSSSARKRSGDKDCMEQQRSGVSNRAVPASAVKELCKNGAVYQRSYSVPFSPSKLPVAARTQAASKSVDSTIATTLLSVAEREIFVIVNSVSGLRDEEGLPLVDCANCFVHLVVLSGGSVQGQSTAAAESQVTTTAFTTRSAVYREHLAKFDDSAVVLIRLPSASTHPVLRCTVYQGTAAVHQKFGSCEVSLNRVWTQTTDGERNYLIVRHAGSPRAHICGHLSLCFTSTGQGNHSEVQIKRRAVQTTPLTEKGPRPHSDVLQQRVLAYLWHHCRADLHRLDSVVEDAATLGFDSAFPQYSSASPDDSSVAPTASLTAGNTVRIALRAASLTDFSSTSGESSSTSNNALGVPAAAKGFPSLYIGWSCGCYGGWSNVHRVSSTSAFLLRLNEELPVMRDVDPWRDELRFVLYGFHSDTNNGSYELCRVHVSLRSFRTCMHGHPDTVQLPLVWHAGERGAFERGSLAIDVEVTEHPFTTNALKSNPSYIFRKDVWKGFLPDWAPRKAVAQMLRCYATDQLHRLLPLLADAEGKEEVLLKRLKATYGSASEPVQLRVCLVQFRCFDPAYRKCYLKLYRGDETLLRTPTFACGGAAGAATGATAAVSGDEHGHKKDAVPLLDEDKYLFYLSTTRPHYDTILLKMGVEHFMKKNDVVAYAEINLAAFVSLESRLEESLHVKVHSGSRSLSFGHTGNNISQLFRLPLWVPLRNDDNETVAEVAIRVEWLHAVPLVPVRRVTTQKKSAVSAVLRANGGCASNEAIPLFDTATARDLFSLLSAYYPEELYRWTWYLSRWADATRAHCRLRRALLPPAVSATVYVDLIGISPRKSASLSRLGTTLSVQGGGEGRGELAVTASCLYCTTFSSPPPAHCHFLSSEAARATAQAAVVLASIDAADGSPSSPQTLRLDLQLPVSNSTEDDLCLFFSIPSYSIPFSFQHSEHKRAFSAPKRGRRSHFAEHFRQLRSRSAATATPVHALLNGGTVSPRRGRSAFQTQHTSASASRMANKQVGRINLSLRALMTTPELYRDGEMVTVPLVTLCESREQRKLEQSDQSAAVAVLGDVYVRVRTPAHETVPGWLRYDEEQLRRICMNGTLSCKDVRFRLQQEQLRFEFGAEACATDLAEVHAAFFRKCSRPQTESCGLGHQSVLEEVAKVTPQGPSASTQRPARPPRVPRQQPQPTSVEQAVGSLQEEEKENDDVFTAHDVFPRVGSKFEKVSELYDFTTPQQAKAYRSVHEWTTEKGGVTVDSSSGANNSTPSLKTMSSHERHLTTKRALIF